MVFLATEQVLRCWRPRGGGSRGSSAGQCQPVSPGLVLHPWPLLGAALVSGSMTLWMDTVLRMKFSALSWSAPWEGQGKTWKCSLELNKERLWRCDGPPTQLPGKQPASSRPRSLERWRGRWGKCVPGYLQLPTVSSLHILDRRPAEGHPGCTSPTCWVKAGGH